MNTMRSNRYNVPSPAPDHPSHNNSQHVLAIIHSNKHSQHQHHDDNVSRDAEDKVTLSQQHKQDVEEAVLEAFRKTSELPIDTVRHTSNNTNASNDDTDTDNTDTTTRIILASNYPECILETENWGVLCAGFAYRYKEAFTSTITLGDGDDDDDDDDEYGSNNAHNDNESNDDDARNNNYDSFARTLLNYCERYGGGEEEGKEEDTNTNCTKDTNQREDSSFEERIGQCFKRCSGHFSVYIIRKGTSSAINSNNKNNSSDGHAPLQFWAWNDPFGFMPVYYHCHQHQNQSNNVETNDGSSSTMIISSYWDCLVPNIIRNVPLSPSQQQQQQQQQQPFESTLELDWDIVAEYITLGTTLGGGGGGGDDDDDDDDDDELSNLTTSSSDRTFIRGIKNLGPGCCIRLSVPLMSTALLGVEIMRMFSITRYITCYGACEEMLCLDTDEDLKSKRDAADLALLEDASHHTHHIPRRSTKHPTAAKHTIRGVQVVDISNKAQPHCRSSNVDDNETCRLLLGFIMDCVGEAQRHVARAALTGGGDTRLLLACLLLHHQQQQQQQLQSKTGAIDNNAARDDIPIIFQTHSKQSTDWHIARYLAHTFRLKHERIHPISTTTNDSRRYSPPNYYLPWRKNENEVLLSNLHDQTPLRRRKKRVGFPWPWMGSEDADRTTEAEYVLHGRFGTEFLGCLCYDKSPLDVRAEELEDFRAGATALFHAAFGAQSSSSSSSSGSGIVRNPVDALHDRFRELERDQMAYAAAARRKDGEQQSQSTSDDDDNNPNEIDVAYAFQLQLYTRSTLSDIYKGLRGGSWFSIPTAQFTRNSITPFLDNRLLRWMMCRVSMRDKEEPYELYGRLYRSLGGGSMSVVSLIPECLLEVPSNNKLLCRHSGIPLARKKPEAKARPHFPIFVTKNKGEKVELTDNDGIHYAAWAILERNFHPVFWKGAIAIFTNAPIVIDPKSIVGDSRLEVRAFLDRVGGDADVACCLSGRLQSFLLWYERRFLVHAK